MLLGLAGPTSGSGTVFGRPYAELDRPATRVGAVLEAAPGAAVLAVWTLAFVIAATVRTDRSDV